jgi:signal transduction histidine kinase
MMFRTLYAKLAFVLFGLFCVVGGAFLIAALFSAQMYQQEVAQRLNRNLAMYVVDEHVLIGDDGVNQSELEDLFHNMMIINPSLELYLLGPQGEIIGHSVDLGSVSATSVSLAPVHQLLEGEKNLPVLGEDPRNPERKRAFSVAPIRLNNELQGYIYAVLGSERVDHVSELLQQSYILRWSAWAMAGGMVFVLLAGLLVFFLLTRRLRRLSKAMEAFKKENFSSPAELSACANGSSDEVDRLGVTFYEMAGRIRSQMEKLRETDALRRELVANVSHDLRTPLASLQGYLETLIIKDDDLSAGERRAYLETVSRHAERLGKLVVELFELAKLEACELEPRVEPFQLAELIHDVVHKFQLRAREKGIELIVDAVPGVPFAEADIGMIERVLDNLIENALQHTPGGGTVRLSLNSNGELLTVQVADTGEGIPADDLPHIFDRFYRKTSGNWSSGDGAGLGLAIAQRIVELHGGTLEVVSEPDAGSSFGFDLPVRHLASA